METTITSSPITSEDINKSYEDSYHQDNCFHNNSAISHQNIFLDSLKHNCIPDSTVSLQDSLLDSCSVSYNDTFLASVESNTVPESSMMNQHIFLDSHEHDSLYELSQDSFLDDYNLHSPPDSSSPVVSTDSYLFTSEDNIVTNSVIDYHNILFNRSAPNSDYHNLYQSAHYQGQCQNREEGPGVTGTTQEDAKHAVGGEEDIKEHVKLMERRRRNKIAATKCRNKKKEKTNMLKCKTRIEEEKNIQLKKAVIKLKEEKKLLVKMLMGEQFVNLAKHAFLFDSLGDSFLYKPDMIDDNA